MQRIVNGNYADPESTRDITGIKPEEYAFLIDTLRQAAKHLQLILSFNPVDRKAYMMELSSIANICFDSSSLTDEMLEVATKVFSDQYTICMKMLEDLNQPYPGAIYFPER